jgi:hypothetical protein
MSLIVFFCGGGGGRESWLKTVGSVQCNNRLVMCGAYQV